MSSSTGTKIEAEPLRTLFNHAGRPVPKQLRETKEEYYKISRGALASLVYSSARINGCDRFRSASLWLKTKLG